MARPVRIAAIQIPRWVEGKTAREKYEWNLHNIEACLQKAGEAGCDITGVGEGSNTRSLSAAEKAQVLGPLLDGPEVEIGSRMAKEHKMNVCLGIVGVHEGKKRNAAVLLDREGKVAGVYHKVQLTRRETIGGTVAGDDFPVFELDFGKVGCLICHDMSFVEAARVLGVRGAEIIL